MDTEIRQLIVMHRGVRKPGTAELSEAADDNIRLVVTTEDRRVESEATDYFEALQKIRRELEQDGMDICCYGSSRNVYPSGMGRSMGLGLKAYRLTIGEQARAPLVDIFDAGPDIELSSVADQDMFFRKWIESIGRK